MGLGKIKVKVSVEAWFWVVFRVRVWFMVRTEVMH